MKWITWFYTPATAAQSEAKPKPKRPWPRRRRKRIYGWGFKLGERSGFVHAASRVDARSLIKRELGIPIKRRLPAEISISKYVDAKQSP